jgi:hypothetical protein
MNGLTDRIRKLSGVLDQAGMEEWEVHLKIVRSVVGIRSRRIPFPEW